MVACTHNGFHVYVAIRLLLEEDAYARLHCQRIETVMVIHNTTRRSASCNDGNADGELQWTCREDSLLKAKIKVNSVARTGATGLAAEHVLGRHQRQAAIRKRTHDLCQQSEKVLSESNGTATRQHVRTGDWSGYSSPPFSPYLAEDPRGKARQYGDLVSTNFSLL